MECCLEQPSILKVNKADGGGCMLLHVDDVLFTMTADFMHKKFLPELKKAFKLSVTWVDRKTGGSFEFLKRLHVFDVGFERLDIYGETKHVKQCVDMFRKANGGKAARLHCTPAVGHVFSGKDDTALLDESMSGTYRSLVGCILYLSHERSDVQHTIKCLASYLSSPTQHAWTQLGRLIGYLQRTSGYGAQMRGTQPGMSLFEKLAEAGKQNCEYSCLVESFSDSDWQGGKDLRSTSSAAHYINGNLIHSSSRSQHVVSLSSTEAEYYAMTSTCIDTIYIKHILEFLLDCDVEAQVKVDNSATRQIANKLGTSKLRHVQGKLLWVQQQVKNGVLKLKQIPTMWNPADLGTKGLTKRRHNMLLYLFGFVDERGEHVGDVEFHELKLQEASKNAIKKVKLVLPSVLSQSSSSSQVAKQVVRMAMLEMVGALGQTVAVDDSIEPNAISEDGGVDPILNFQTVGLVCFAGVMLALMMALFFMVVDDSGDSGSEESPEARRRRYLFSTISETSDPDYWMQLNHHEGMSDASNDEPEVEVDEAGPQVNTPLQYGMFHVYLFMQGNFQRLRHLMQTDHAMQGRGYTVLTWLLKNLKDYETNGITPGRVHHMQLLHCTINEMEQVVLERGGSRLAIQDVGQGQIYQNFSDNLQLEPEGEEPTEEEIAEKGIRLWQEELPEPETEGSPESMATWMIKRLTRRIVLGCVEGRPAMCRYMAMRETMRDVLRACSRSAYNRSRAM